MAENIEHITAPLKAKGALKWSSAVLYDGVGEVVITLRLTSLELASEVYETIEREIDRDNFRLGSLNLRREG